MNVEVLFGNKESRSYRISSRKIKQQIGFNTKYSVEDAVLEIYNILRSGKYTDFTNPIYYNIEWMRQLVEMEKNLKVIGRVF